MKYLIIDTKEVSNLQGGFNKVTGEQLSHLMNKSFLSENMSEDLSCKVKAGLVVRSLYSNEVLTYSKDKILATKWVHEDPRQLVGSFLLLVNVQAILMETLEDIPVEDISRSPIMPVGILKKGNEITIVFHLILGDKIFNQLKLRDTGLETPFVKIELLPSFTNLSEQDKMILQTLILVRSDNIENNSGGKQGV